MTTRQREEFIVLLILIVVASFSGSLLYTYALKVGIDADLVTVVYLAGLFAGIIIMLIAIRMSRRTNRNRTGETNDENAAESGSEICLELSERPIPAITLIVITVAMVYPIRLYAPDAKALIIPLIYSVGILPGGLLMWIPDRVPLYSSEC